MNLTFPYLLSDLFLSLKPRFDPSVASSLSLSLILVLPPPLSSCPLSFSPCFHPFPSYSIAPRSAKKSPSLTTTMARW